MEFKRADEKPTAAIIGSGVSGICAFIQLKKQLGITAKVFEMNKNIGGVWTNNTYPGCRCDVPSHLYSFSFELNPNWTQSCSSQEEILQYLQGVCEKYDMIKNIAFETKVLSAVWMQDIRKWQLAYQGQKEGSLLPVTVEYFDFLFSALGSLRVPNIPEEFKHFKGGPIVHTGNWDSSIDFQNKRVALVGSGSSGIQVLPHLAKQAAQLTAYQRSAPWVFRLPIADVTSTQRKILYQFPVVNLMYRLLLYIVFEILYMIPGYPGSFLAKAFANKTCSDNIEQLIQLGREEWVDKLIPKYTVGCKRGAFSPNYYKVLSDYNVNVIRAPIRSINNNTIVSEDGEEVQADILVLATGFKTHDGMLGDIKILGKEDQSLTETWEQTDPELFKSTTVHGFPNFFMLLGPYSILGHNSVIVMVETQMNYAIRCIREIWMKHNMVIEPKKESQDMYMTKINASFQGTAWLSSCTSWYKNKRGKIINLYPSTATRFQWELFRFSKTDYVGF